MSSDGDNILDQAVNVGTQLFSGGLVGYEDGKFGKGVTTRALDEGVGEVTGRNAVRKQQMEAKDAIDAERQARAKQLADEAQLEQQNDIAASNFAGAQRSAARAQAGIFGNASSNVNRDFLGL